MGLGELALGSAGSVAALTQKSCRGLNSARYVMGIGHRREGACPDVSEGRGAFVNGRARRAWRPGIQFINYVLTEARVAHEQRPEGLLILNPAPWAAASLGLTLSRSESGGGQDKRLSRSKLIDTVKCGALNVPGLATVRLPHLRTDTPNLRPCREGSSV